MRRPISIAAMVFVAALILVVGWSLLNEKNTKASAETAAAVDHGIEQMDKALERWMSGDRMKAAATWHSASLRTIPATTDADNTLQTAYYAYANDMRYYFLGDASVTLKQLEAAREKAKATLEEMSP